MKHRQNIPQNERNNLNSNNSSRVSTRLNTSTTKELQPPVSWSEVGRFIE